MKKIILVIIILIAFASVTYADINSDAFIYYDMAYPSKVNSVGGQSSPFINYFAISNYPNGIIGSASSYNGPNARFDLGGYSIYSQNSFSIWLNTNVVGTGYFWTREQIGGWHYYYGYSNPGNGLQIDIFKPTAPSFRCRLAVTGLNIEDTNWHNVIIVKNNDVCDPTTFSVYVDGILNSNFTFLNSNPIDMSFFNSQPISFHWMIGVNQVISFNGGYIDEVGQWPNYSLTPADVALIYNSGLGNAYPFPTCTPNWSCVGYGNCTQTNTRPCNAVIDLNSCGDSYTGDYSEFTPLICDFCTPNWICTVCELSSCTNARDNNTCNEPYNGSLTCQVQGRIGGGGGGGGGGNEIIIENISQPVIVPQPIQEQPICKGFLACIWEKIMIFVKKIFGG